MDGGRTPLDPWARVLIAPCVLAAMVAMVAMVAVLMDGPDALL